MNRTKETIKAFGRSLWHHVGKYVFAMLVAGAIVKNTDLDAATAQTIANGAAAAVTEAVQ